jgi:hypothetical protein
LQGSCSQSIRNHKSLGANVTRGVGENSRAGFAIVSEVTEQASTGGSAYIIAANATVQARIGAARINRIILAGRTSVTVDTRTRGSAFIVGTRSTVQARIGAARVGRRSFTVGASVAVDAAA